MPLEPLDYRSPSTERRTWVDGAWDRPDLIAAAAIIAANGLLWSAGGLWRGGWGLAFVLFLWTIPLNGALLMGGLFATPLLRQELGNVFDRYMKWVILGPLVAIGINYGFLLVELLIAQPWQSHGYPGGGF